MEAARIADDIEAAAYRDMYAAATPDIRRVLAMQAQRIDNITLLMARGVPDPVFARVIGLGNDGRCDPGLLEDVVNAYAESKIDDYWIHFNPALAPRELHSLLEARGFLLAKRRSWAKMVRGTETVTPIESPLDIHRAQLHERHATAVAIASAFGMPVQFADWIEALANRESWTMFTASDGEHVVGGGMLFVDGRHAWLGLGGIIAEARHKRGHRAVMAARIGHALDLGCTHVVTETGEPIDNEPNPSLRNMYRLGFQKVASRLNFKNR